jgi:hypothetical protein
VSARIGAARPGLGIELGGGRTRAGAPRATGILPVLPLAWRVEPAPAAVHPINPDELPPASPATAARSGALGEATCRPVSRKRTRGTPPTHLKSAEMGDSGYPG